MNRVKAMATFFIATTYVEGSSSRYYFTLADELASRGHRVFMIVAEQRHDAVDTESNPAVLTWPSKAPTKWRDAKFLRSLIRQHDPQCIIGNFSAENLCVLVGWLNRVPLRIVWGHTLTSAIAADGIMPRWKHDALKVRKRLVYRLATHFIANSEALRNDLCRTYGIPAGRIRVIYYLLADPPYDPSRPRREAVIYAGRFSRCKGLDVLIRAIPIVRDARPGVIFEFLGDGPLRPEIESLADALGVSDSCRFLGAIPHAAAYERISEAALLASPSIHEAFGLVNAEAHSVGTPIVGSNVDGIKEIVLDGVTGFLVPPGDPAALAGKIIQLLQDEDLQRRFGRAARERFERMFSNRRISEHAEYFERLAERA